MQWIKLKILVLICISTLTFISITACESKDRNDPGYNLRIHLKQLEKDPNNCFVLSQVAAIYGALNDIDNQIRFYEKTIHICPDDFMSRFQLGISYYVHGDQEKGTQYMDRAIKDAELYRGHEVAEMLKTEKSGWINKGEIINQE